MHNNITKRGIKPLNSSSYKNIFKGYRLNIQFPKYKTDRDFTLLDSFLKFESKKELATDYNNSQNMFKKTNKAIIKLNNFLKKTTEAEYSPDNYFEAKLEDGTIILKLENIGKVLQGTFNTIKTIYFIKREKSEHIMFEFGSNLKK